MINFLRLLTLFFLCFAISSFAMSKQYTYTALGSNQLYHAKTSKGKIYFLNSEHRLCATFDKMGANIRGNQGSVRFKARSIGYGEKQASLKQSTPIARQNRVEYHRGSLLEWYVNGPIGLEQGFTVPRPPVRKGEGLLTITLDLSGNLKPILNPDQTITFKNASGKTTHYYKGLVAYDARGKELPAQLKLEQNTLFLIINDRQAHYPLVIDPWIVLDNEMSTRPRL